MMPRSFIIVIFLFLGNVSIFCNNIDSLRVQYHLLPDGIEKHETAIAIAQFFNENQSSTDSIIKYTVGFEEFIRENEYHPLILDTKFHLLSSHYRNDSSSFYKEGHRLIEEANREKRYDLVGETIVLLGGKYNKLSGFIQGVELMEKGLELLEGQKDPLSLYYIARFCSLLAAYHNSQGNLIKSLEYGLRVQSLATEIEDDNLLLRSYFNLGSLYGTLSSDEQKLVPEADRDRYRKLNYEYLQKAYDFCKDKPDNRSKGMATYNLGLYYSFLKEFNKSKVLMMEAKAIGESLPWDRLLFNAYDVLSGDLSESGKMDSSFYYMEKAYALAQQMNSSYHIMRSQINFGNYYTMTGNYAKARLYGDLALKEAIARKLNSKKILIYDLLHEIESKSGNYDVALRHFKKKVELKDSILGEEHLEQVNELKARYDHVQQKSEIQKLKEDSLMQQRKIERKNSIIFISILTGLFISFVIYFLYREKTLKAEKRELDAQQKLLRSQLNPHFLFNALNSIQQYIYLQKEPKLVADYLAKFSRLTRRILNNSNKDLIEIKEEVDFLRDYMDLQKLRFDVPFDYSIIVDEELVDEGFKIPPMFTQPFIENSIEHGILNKKEKGKIDVHISRANDQVQIELIDNGIGIDKSTFKKKNSHHRSMAINLTKERLKALDKKLRARTDLIITDLAGVDKTITGTQVTLMLPLLH